VCLVSAVLALFVSSRNEPLADLLSLRFRVRFVSVFWEQQGLQAFGQKIQITRPAQASQPAFDKHFDELLSIYGPVHAVKFVPSSPPPFLSSLTFLFRIIAASLGKKTTKSS